jgi:hypothetical protein
MIVARYTMPHDGMSAVTRNRRMNRRWTHGRNAEQPSEKRKETRDLTLDEPSILIEGRSEASPGIRAGEL